MAAFVCTLVAQEIRADRDMFNAVKSGGKQEAAAAAPKLLIRVRYNVEGKKGRKPVEVEGTAETVSLFHFYQALFQEALNSLSRGGRGGVPGGAHEAASAACQ